MNVFDFYIEVLIGVYFYMCGVNCKVFVVFVLFVLILIMFVVVLVFSVMMLFLWLFGVVIVGSVYWLLVDCIWYYEECLGEYIVVVCV